MGIVRISDALQGAGGGGGSVSIGWLHCDIRQGREGREMTCWSVKVVGGEEGWGKGKIPRDQRGFIVRQLHRISRGVK